MIDDGDAINTPDNYEGPGTMLLLNNGDVSTDVSHYPVLREVLCVVRNTQHLPVLYFLPQLVKNSPGSSVDSEPS